jgi:lipid-A-disaccharide synthase-like uncharacterized protein
MFEILGVIGIAISVAAYVPQVIHLAREHCSAGVSSRAWAMWLGGGLLVGVLAVQRGDPVFILLQLSSLTFAAVILLLARRYKGMACETHAHAVPSDQATVTALSRRNRSFEYVGSTTSPSAVTGFASSGQEAETGRG